MLSLVDAIVSTRYVGRQCLADTNERENVSGLLFSYLQEQTFALLGSSLEASQQSDFGEIISFSLRT